MILKYSLLVDRHLPKENLRVTREVSTQEMIHILIETVILEYLSTQTIIKNKELFQKQIKAKEWFRVHI